MRGVIEKSAWAALLAACFVTTCNSLANIQDREIDMPVTSIQDVINATGRSILFINTEFSGNNAEILDGQDVSVNNCWIPWCTNNSDFAAHHIQIQDETGDVLWFIWQNGPLVRASQTGFDPDASPINGEANVGQSLTLAINKVSIRTYRGGGVPPFIDPDLPL